MKLIELIEKYKGTAKFDVDTISDGESKDAIVFTNAEHEAVKDEIVNGEIVRYYVSAFVNNAPTINVVVKPEEKQPEQLPEKPSEASPKNQTIPEASNTPNVSVAVAHHPGNAIAENVDQPNRLEDGFIEITDPEEAERIVMEIGRLLASNTQKTNEAILHLEKTVDEYKEITKSILR